MKVDVEETIKEDEFKYGDYKISVEISIEKGSKFIRENNPLFNNINFPYKYGGYYREISVYAHKGVKKNSIVEKTVICPITEERKPDFEVPEDPKLSIKEKLLLPFSDFTKEELKEQKRKELKNKWNEEHVPEGPEVEIEKHLRMTIVPVLDELDKINQYTGRDISIEVETTMEYMDKREPKKNVDEIVENIELSE